MFLRMALLNLLKHRRRTILIVFAIMVSVLVMEVMAGMFEGMRVNFFRNLTRESGHIQIHAPGYRDRLNPFTLDYVISGYEEITAALREIDGVLEAEEVLHFGALLEHEGRDLTMAGVGVRKGTRFYRDVREGIRGGTFPGDDAQADHTASGVLLSVAVARLLNLEQGDRVNVIVEDSTGSPYYLQLPLTGLFETSSPDLDEYTFFIDHESAQDLVYLEGGTIEIRLRLLHADEADAVAARIPGHLRRAGIDADLDVRTWRELHGGLTSLLEMMDFFILAMNVFVIIVVASVITNAILMNVFERMRVIGTMRAIGLKRRSAGAMILAEGAIQGVIGSALGLAAGIPIVLYFSVNGLDWGGISEAFGMGSSYYYFGYSLHNSVISALGGVLVALSGSLYAAWVGMRLTIMEALHHV
ncbi:MAG: ABC transporter permease [Spirochaetaceae bacterium]|nr:MAG: ABC transporter permease [Spirochaetaceae bacterium]